NSPQWRGCPWPSGPTLNFAPSSSSATIPIRRRPPWPSPLASGSQTPLRADSRPSVSAWPSLFPACSLAMPANGSLAPAARTAPPCPPLPQPPMSRPMLRPLLSRSSPSSSGPTSLYGTSSSTTSFRTTRCTSCAGLRSCSPRSSSSGSSPGSRRSAPTGWLSQRSQSARLPHPSRCCSMMEWSMRRTYSRRRRKLEGASTRNYAGFGKRTYSSCFAVTKAGRIAVQSGRDISMS
ncbi:hypothetical protein B0H14DRAFT_2788006, partial [Mycena olivaceomarginata]